MNKTNKSRIIKLFGVLNVMYGNLWSSRFDSKGMLAFGTDVWHKALEKFGDIEIEFALAKCFELDYPPTLPQFLKQCSVQKNDIDVPSATQSLTNKDENYKKIMSRHDEYNFKRMPEKDALFTYRAYYADLVDEELKEINGNQRARTIFMKSRIGDEFLLTETNTARANYKPSSGICLRNPSIDTKKKRSLNVGVGL